MPATYVIEHRDRRAIMLFAAPSLNEIAAALNAQPDRDQLVVYWLTEGFSRDLTDQEAERLRELTG